MTKEEFLEKAGEVLDLPGSLDAEQRLDELETFDSLSILNLIGLYDELEIEVTVDDVNNAQFGHELLALAERKLEI